MMDSNSWLTGAADEPLSPQPPMQLHLAMSRGLSVGSGNVSGDPSPSASPSLAPLSPQSPSMPDPLPSSPMFHDELEGLMGDDGAVEGDREADDDAGLLMSPQDSSLPPSNDDPFEVESDTPSSPPAQAPVSLHSSARQRQLEAMQMQQQHAAAVPMSQQQQQLLQQHELYKQSVLCPALGLCSASGCPLVAPQRARAATPPRCARSPFVVTLFAPADAIAFPCATAAGLNDRATEPQSRLSSQPGKHSASQHASRIGRGE